MAEFEKKAGRRVSIEEAKKLESTGALIWWRPEESLPEEEQYAIVYE